MRIEHLINGKSVAGKDYFETVNPATQDVLAEVASGTATEVNAAVQAAKDAFPAWAGRPATERAKIMRNLGDLIAKPSAKQASSWCRARQITFTTFLKCARASMDTPIPRPRI